MIIRLSSRLGISQDYAPLQQLIRAALELGMSISVRSKFTMLTTYPVMSAGEFAIGRYARASVNPRERLRGFLSSIERSQR